MVGKWDEESGMPDWRRVLLCPRAKGRGGWRIGIGTGSGAATSRVSKWEEEDKTQI